jgi:hypothetical protein
MIKPQKNEAGLRLLAGPGFLLENMCGVEFCELFPDPERARRTVGQLAYAGYCAVAFFFIGCLSASGLRACGFTAVSSTGVVPGTSLENVAPEGTM